MPTYITIGYGDEGGYERTPAEVKERAHAHDAALRERGVLMGIAGKPVRVRSPNGEGTRVEEGAFSRSDLPVAGFAVLEASSLEEAIALAAKSPCAVAHGVVEVWPLEVPPKSST